jgi:hypothetical protein
VATPAIHDAQEKPHPIGLEAPHFWGFLRTGRVQGGIMLSPKNSMENVLSGLTLPGSESMREFEWPINITQQSLTISLIRRRQNRLCMNLRRTRIQDRHDWLTRRTDRRHLLVTKVAVRLLAAPDRSGLSRRDAAKSSIGRRPICA